MGIFMIVAGVVLGMVSFVIFGSAQAITGQIFAGETAICGAVLFGAGGIVMAIDTLRAGKAAADLPPI